MAKSELATKDIQSSTGYFAAILATTVLDESASSQHRPLTVLRPGLRTVGL